MKAKSYIGHLFAGQNITGKSFAGCDLTSADFRATNLYDVNFNGATLAYTNFRNADIRCANGLEKLVIDGGVRSDGYRFLLTRTEPGGWKVKAGCRILTLAQAKAHWRRRRYNTIRRKNLDVETRLIIKNMVAIAKHRKWPKTGVRKWPVAK